MLKDKVINWTKNQFANTGRDTAVIGISGGKDSAVVAAILCEAIGKNNVLGVLIPNGFHNEDYEDSVKVCEELGIKYIEINIFTMYQSMIEKLRNINDKWPSTDAQINIAPRLRMTTLYSIAQSLSAEGKHPAVVGTGNKSEHYVGYFTKWGDGGCDINPIQDLWCHEVIQLGIELGYFPEIVKKTPADGLCGKSDEDNLGFSYDDVYSLVTLGTCGDKKKDALIKKKHEASRHKEEPIPCFKNI